jgi:hypothetical protein
LGEAIAPDCPNIAIANAVRTFLIPETLNSTPFFPDALAPNPDALAILASHR